MAAPYLIVGLGGDSGGMWGKYRLTDGSDDAGPSIFQYKQDNTIAVANEPLDNGGYSAADAQAGQVGNTVALCRLLRDGGHLPSGYDILIVPRCVGGTAFESSGGLGPWAEGESMFLEFTAALQEAVALHAQNRIWFISWDHGANDQGSDYAEHLTTLVNHISDNVSTAKFAPWLISGLPKNWLDASPPFSGDLTDADLRAVASYLPNAHYINVDHLTALDTSNGQIHHPRVHHVGGTNNAPGNVGEVISVADSIAGLKYAALTGASARPFRTRITWS